MVCKFCPQRKHDDSSERRANFNHIGDINEKVNMANSPPLKTNNMNTHVNFETAKLLKEKGFIQGFDSNQKFYYPLTKELTENHRGDNYPAPTISEVVMWLYEKHGIWIDVCTNQFSKPKHLEWMYSIIFTERCTYSHSPKSYNSPTEAYEAAILYTLNNLI